VNFCGEHMQVWGISRAASPFYIECHHRDQHDLHMTSPTCQSLGAPRIAQRSHAAPMLRAAWIVTAVFTLSNAATPLYAIWRAEFGFGAAIQALIFSCYVVGLLGALLMAGQLSDHFGRRTVLMPAIVSAMIAAVLFEMAEGVSTLMIARFLTGASVGAIVSAGMANVVDSACESRKHHASLLASIAMVLGAGIGPFVAGLFAEFTSTPLRYVFGLELALLAIAMACVIALPTKRATNTAFRLRLPSAPAGAAMLIVRGIFFFGPGLTATSFVLSLGPNLLAAALHSNSPLIAGGAAFGMFMVAVGVQLVCRKLTVRQTFFTSGIATTASMVALWLSVTTSSAVWLVAAAMLAGMGQGLGQLGGFTLIAVHISGGRRAEANGLMNMGAYVPAGLLPVGTGLAMDHLGLVPGVSLLAAAIAGTAVLAMGLFRRAR
jgi:MFS family permease